jgi:exodeoxyribonuclease III
MKIVSWNCNGFRSVLRKTNLIDDTFGTFQDFINKYQPDILCLSEIKMNCNVNSIFSEILPEYQYKFWSHCEGKAGRHGVAIFSKLKPLAEVDTLGESTNRAGESTNRAGESTNRAAENNLITGRYIHLEFEKFFIVNVYVQNSGVSGLQNVKARQVFDQILFARLQQLKKTKKEVIVTGDFNVVHLPIDTSNFAGQHNRVAGVLDFEMNNFQMLLDSGFVNVFRHLYPRRRKYTYFSYFRNGRKRGSGMMIDYFLVTPGLVPYISDMKVLDDIYGSDHLPIELIFNE